MRQRPSVTSGSCKRAIARHKPLSHLVSSSTAMPPAGKVSPQHRGQPGACQLSPGHRGQPGAGKISPEHPGQRRAGLISPGHRGQPGADNGNTLQAIKSLHAMPWHASLNGRKDQFIAHLNSELSLPYQSAEISLWRYLLSSFRNDNVCMRLHQCLNKYHLVCFIK